MSYSVLTGGPVVVWRRHLMPKLVLAPGQAGWPHLERLLVALLRFLEPYLRNADLTDAIRNLYKVPPFLCCLPICIVCLSVNPCCTRLCLQAEPAREAEKGLHGGIMYCDSCSVPVREHVLLTLCSCRQVSDCLNILPPIAAVQPVRMSFRAAFSSCKRD